MGVDSTLAVIAVFVLWQDILSVAAGENLRPPSLVYFIVLRHFCFVFVLVMMLFVSLYQLAFVSLRHGIGQDKHRLFVWYFRIGYIIGDWLHYLILALIVPVLRLFDLLPLRFELLDLRFEHQ